MWGAGVGGRLWGCDLRRTTQRGRGVAGYDSLRAALVARLDQGDRGDRGWFLITRVHLSAARVKGLCDYVLTRGEGKSFTPGPSDYAQLAQFAGVKSLNPGMVLRRHHLLALEVPLRLIRRTDGRSWAEIELTDRGRQLASSDDINEILEESLDEFVFCRHPWYTGSRIHKYSEYDVTPYIAVKRLLVMTEGWIDRDEFDLFVSRIRGRVEIEYTVRYIREYRELSDGQQADLRNEVRIRTPSAKTHQNWRDLALHTFSLFSLGTTAVRDGIHLRLASSAIERGRAPKKRAVRTRETTASPRKRALSPLLTVPEVPITDELQVPPVEPATNSGTDAELLIGKLLRADGWTVGYYSKRRGFGFDLWAQRQQVGLVIEVKSSIDQMNTVVLTPTEYEAAVVYGANYILAIVEQVSTSSPVVRMIQDPVAATSVEQQNALRYAIRRASWETAATTSSVVNRSVG